MKHVVVTALASPSTDRTDGNGMLPVTAVPSPFSGCFPVSVQGRCAAMAQEGYQSAVVADWQQHALGMVAWGFSASCVRGCGMCAASQRPVEVYKCRGVLSLAEWCGEARMAGRVMPGLLHTRHTTYRKEEEKKVVASAPTPGPYVTSWVVSVGCGGRGLCGSLCIRCHMQSRVHASYGVSTVSRMVSARYQGVVQIRMWLRPMW